MPDPGGGERGRDLKPLSGVGWEQETASELQIGFSLNWGRFGKVSKMTLYQSLMKLSFAVSGE